jgi:hypothetical protein
MSAAMGAIIKKYKRTLTNFQEDFLIPFIKKAAFRYMQFDPERYPSVEMNFVPTATLGIMAREYEQQQFIALLQTLGPNTPVLPIILKGIISNSSLSNRYEMMAELDKMSQPDPQQQELAQAQAQLQLQALQAQIAVNTTQAKRNDAEAMNTMMETELMPKEVEAKIISSTTQNLPNNDALASQEFDRRVKIADLMLKEKDIENKLKVVEMQTAAKTASKQNDSDFLKKIIGE